MLEERGRRCTDEVERATRREYGEPYDEAQARVRGRQGQAHRQPVRAAQGNGERRQAGQDQDRNPLHRTLPGPAQARRPPGHRAARRHLQQSVARLRARVLSKTAPSSAPSSACRRRPSVSSGASVKASLLFLQKFSDGEQADFDAKKQAGAGGNRSQVRGQDGRAEGHPGPAPPEAGATSPAIRNSRTKRKSGYRPRWKKPTPN